MIKLDKYRQLCDWRRKSVHPTLNKLIRQYGLKLSKNKHNSWYRLDLPNNDFRCYESLGSASEIAINKAVKIALNIDWYPTSQQILDVFPTLK